MLSAWDPAPPVVGGAALLLLLFAQAFVRLRRRGCRRHAGASRALLFVLAVAIGTLALVSPIDEIGESSFLSVHMLQHVLIGDVAPALALVALRGPLLFFMFPSPVLRTVARLRALRRLLAFLLRPAVALAAWTVVVGEWHVPAAYDYALTNQIAHDLEHVSFIVVGLLVWTQLIDPARRRALTLRQRLAYAVVLWSLAQVLVCVLVLAPPLYPAYDSQRDQQLAGAVMLVEQLAALGLCAAYLLRALYATGATRRSATLAHDQRFSTARRAAARSASRSVA